MSKIVDYKIASGDTPQELGNKVRSLLKQGFKPLGGVVVQEVGDKYYKIVQTMIKEEDSTNEILKSIDGALRDIDARINQVG